MLHNNYMIYIEEDIEDDIEKNIEDNIEKNIEKNIEDNIEKNIEDNIEDNIDDFSSIKCFENIEDNRGYYLRSRYIHYIVLVITCNLTLINPGSNMCCALVADKNQHL